MGVAHNVAAIIPTVGRPDALSECLGSLGAQTMRPSTVIVVHSGSDRATPAVCESAPTRFGLPVTYLHSPHRGAALQRDLAIRSTAQPFLLLCEDDVVYEPAWTETLLSEIDRDSRIGAVMGRIVNQPLQLPHGIWRLYRRLVATPSRAVKPGALIGPLLNNGFPANASAPMVAEWIGGGLALVRRDAYLSVGGFAAHFRDSSPGEDLDLGYRLSRLWSLFYVPAARCVHNPASSGRDAPAHYQYLSVRARFAHCRDSAKASVLVSFGHIILWSVFQTLSELSQLRRGQLRADFVQASWGRLRGVWSCIGWNPAKERFPEPHEAQAGPR